MRYILLYSALFTFCNFIACTSNQNSSQFNTSCISNTPNCISCVGDTCVQIKSLPNSNCNSSNYIAGIYDDWPCTLNDTILCYAKSNQCNGEDVTCQLDLGCWCNNGCAAGLCDPPYSNLCFNSSNTPFCSDVERDPQNCGSCGNSCGTSGSCNKGQCMCNGVATDLQTDSNNCGNCGTKCAGNSTCVQGQCGCSGTPTNVLSDQNNCGTCGTQCSGESYMCINGKCESPFCQGSQQLYLCCSNTQGGYEANSLDDLGNYNCSLPLFNFAPCACNDFYNSSPLVYSQNCAGQQSDRSC